MAHSRCTFHFPSALSFSLTAERKTFPKKYLPLGMKPRKSFLQQLVYIIEGNIYEIPNLKTFTRCTISLHITNIIKDVYNFQKCQHNLKEMRKLLILNSSFLITYEDFKSPELKLDHLSSLN